MPSGRPAPIGRPPSVRLSRGAAMIVAPGASWTGGVLLALPSCDDRTVPRSRQPRRSRPARSSRPLPGARGHARRAGVAALIALSLGLVTIVLGQGFSTIGAVRALEGIAAGVLVAAVLMGAAAFVAVRLAGWRNPEAEREFEEIVRHSE